MVRMIRCDVCAKTTNHRGELNELLPRKLIIGGANNLSNVSGALERCAWK